MSSHCLCRLGSAFPKRVIHRPFFSARLQSQSAQKGRRSGVRNLLIYGGIAINGVVVGSILYANHSPSFKRLADSYVPGFEALVDQSTAIWNTGQTVIEEWWKKIKGMSAIDNKEEKKETSNKQNEHILLAIKKTVEEEATQKPQNKAPEITSNTSQPSSKTGKKPEATQPSLTSSNQPPASSDKNGKQTASSKQEKPTTKPVSGSQPSATSNKNNKQAVPQEKHTADAETSPVAKPSPVSSSQPSAPSNKNDKQAVPQEKPTTAVKTNTSAKTSTSSAQSTAASADRSDGGSAPSADTSPASVPPNATTAAPPLPKVEVPTSEADELSRAYKKFAAESDLLLSSQQELALAIAVHHLQQQEATKTPMSEEQRRTIAGSIIGTKQAIDNSRKEVEHALKRQREAADALESAMSATKDAAMVKRVNEEMQSYIERIREAGKVIINAETSERQWLQEQEKARAVETSLDDQLEMEVQKRVVEALKKERQLFDKEMSEMLNRVLAEKAKELKETLIQKEEEMERAHEQKLKDELLLQSRAHRYHLHETLEQQADQLSQEWSEELSTKLRDVEEAHLQEMVAAFNELKGVQSTISTVVEADRATRRQQSVRTACDALTRAIVTADSNPDPLKKHSISSQVSVLLQTGEQDQFITTVLSAIPKEAVVDGISSEAGLKTRFKHVRKICQRVALVPEGGAGLGTYLISYLQSLFVINVGHSRVTDGTDTFDILREADTFITQGHLDRAVILINQLQGEPKRVARDWLREAKLYLETRQAVTVVAEYLAAASISVLK